MSISSGLYYQFLAYINDDNDNNNFNNIEINNDDNNIEINDITNFIQMEKEDEIIKKYYEEYDEEYYEEYCNLFEKYIYQSKKDFKIKRCKKKHKHKKISSTHVYINARKYYNQERKKSVILDQKLKEKENKKLKISLQLSLKEENIFMEINNYINNITITCGLTQEQISDLLSREITPEDYDLLLLLDNDIKKKTVSQTILNSFPIRIFSENDMNISIICSVCLSNFEIGEKIKEIPSCKHIFHEECIDKWLTNSSNKCPIDNYIIET